MIPKIKDIVIIGSGGFAREVTFLIEQINQSNYRWNILGYIDNQAKKSQGKYGIIADDEWLLNSPKEIYVAIGIGNPQTIKYLSEFFLQNKNIKFPNLIHPNTIYEKDSLILGNGNIICANNIFTVDVKIGSFNIFNLSCTVGHDTIVGSNNVFNPNTNISGNVHIGNNCLFGTSSTVLQNTTINNNVTIGAAALINKDIKESGTYVGIPAKRIK